MRGKVTRQYEQIAAFLRERRKREESTLCRPLTNLTPYRWAKPAHILNQKQTTQNKTTQKERKKGENTVFIQLLCLRS